MSLNIIDTIYNFIDKLKGSAIEKTKKDYTIYNKKFINGNEITYYGQINYNYLDIEYTFILIQTNEFIQKEKEEKEEEKKGENIGYIFLENKTNKVINEQTKQIGNPFDKNYCIFIHDIYNNRYNRICPELSFIQNKDFCNLPNTETCNKLKGILSLIGNFLLYYKFNGDFIVQDNSQKSFKKVDTNIIIKKEKIRKFKECIDTNIDYEDYIGKIFDYITMNEMYDDFENYKYYFYIIIHYNIDILKDENINFITYFNEELPEITNEKYQQIQEFLGQVYTEYYIDLWLYKRLINDFIDIKSDKKLIDILTIICKNDKLKNLDEKKYLYERNTKSTYSSFNIYFIEKKDAIIFNYIIERIKEKFKDDIDKLKEISKITNDNIEKVYLIFEEIRKFTINIDEFLKFGEDYKEYLEKIYHKEKEIKCKDLLSQINNYLQSYDINNFTCELHGGKNYYNKYIKYKLKYLNLKNKI